MITRKTQHKLQPLQLPCTFIETPPSGIRVSHQKWVCATKASICFLVTAMSMTVCWHKKAQALSRWACTILPNCSASTVPHKTSWEVLRMLQGTWKWWSRMGARHYLSKCQARYSTNVCRSVQALHLLSCAHCPLRLSPSLCGQRCWLPQQFGALSLVTSSPSVRQSWHHLCSLFLTWSFLFIIESRAPVQALFMSWQHHLSSCFLPNFTVWLLL